MARPRTPKERAEVTGAAKVNPSRFAKRSNPRTGSLGVASAWMSAEQATAWEGFRVEFPWLQASDRGLTEIASVIRARLITGEDVGMTALNQLRLCYAMMGGSPADRSKVTIVEEPEEDPTDKYFN